MKRFKLFLLLAALFCGSATFVGCSDDDDNGGASLLVGTWINPTINGGTTMIFYSDGSVSSRDSFYSMSGTWHYNSSNKLLTISWKANAYNSGGTHIYYVTVLTETELVYTTTYLDDENVIHSFTRKQ